MSATSKVLYVRVDPRLRSEVDRYCAKTGLTITELVTDAIWEYVQTEDLRDPIREEAITNEAEVSRRD